MKDGEGQKEQGGRGHFGYAQCRQAPALPNRVGALMVAI